VTSAPRPRSSDQIGWPLAVAVSLTVTVARSMAVAPALSVTVSVAVKVPAVAQVCATVAPLPDAPSPKAGRTSELPSGSDDRAVQRDRDVARRRHVGPAFAIGA
jgi:hypothetical protein